MSDYDFSGLSLMDLVQMHKELKAANFPEDRKFLNAVLTEIAERDRAQRALDKLAQEASKHAGNVNELRAFFGRPPIKES